jgi:hypothetical protein
VPAGQNVGRGSEIAVQRPNEAGRRVAHKAKLIRDMRHQRGFELWIAGANLGITDRLKENRSVVAAGKPPFLLPRIESRCPIGDLLDDV